MKQELKPSVRNNISTEDLAKLIMPEVLSGLDPKSISQMYKIKVSKIIKARNYILETQNAKQKEKENTTSIVGITETPKFTRNEEPVDVDKLNKEFEKRNNDRKRSILSEDLKRSVAEDYKSGNYTHTQLADKYSVSLSSVGRIINSLVDKDTRDEIAAKNIDNARHKSTSNKAKATYKLQSNSNKNATYPETLLESSDLTEINTYLTKSIYYKEYGLISHRHDMGDIDYIFDAPLDDKIFDFKYLENHVRGFIKEHVNYDSNTGLPTHGLIVKCTGMQSPLVAVVKVCYEMKINLIAAHYQFNKGVPDEYRLQKIFSDFPMFTKSSVITKYLATYDKLYLFKSHADDYMDDILNKKNGSYCMVSVDSYDKESRDSLFKGSIPDVNVASFAVLAKNMYDIMGFVTSLTLLYANHNECFCRVVRVYTVNNDEVKCIQKSIF